MDLPTLIDRDGYFISSSTYGLLSHMTDKYSAKDLSIEVAAANIATWGGDYWKISDAGWSFVLNEEQIISDCPIDGAISVRVDCGFGGYRWFV